MAYEISNYSVKVTLVAAASLTDKQYHFVKVDSDGEAAICSGTTDKPIGILQNAPAAGEEAEVLVVGGSKLVAGEALDEGNAVGTGADARGEALTIGTDTTRYHVATCIFPAGADGEMATVVLNAAAPARAA